MVETEKFRKVDKNKYEKAKPSSVSLRHFGNNTILYGVGNSVLRGASFLLVPIYVHYLSVSEYGTLETALLTIQILIVFMGVGIPSAIIRYYAKDARNDDAGGLLGSSLGVVGLAMLISSLLFLLVPSFVFSKMAEIQIPFTFKILIVVPAIAECLTIIAMSIFRAQDKAGKYTLITIGTASFLTLFTLLLLPGLNQRLSGALMARGLAYGSIGLITTYLLVRFNSLRFSIEKARAVFRFGYPLTFAALGWFVLLSSDRYFLVYYSGMHEVGIYSLGCKLTLLLLVLVVWPFELTYGPFVFASLDHDRMRIVMSRLLTYLILALTVVGYLIVLLGKDIINLIAPKEYAAAYLVTICLLPTAGLQGLHYWSNAQLHIMQKTSHIAAVIGAAAVFNVLLNYLLVPRYGWVGAAVATNISILVAVGTLVVIGFSVFPIPLELRRLGIVASVGVALCFSYVITHGLRSPHIYFANSVVLLAIPFFLYSARFFNSSEKQFLKNLLAFKGRQR
jgi:O-antigen/teichoic acid export membrane protein